VKSKSSKRLSEHTGRILILSLSMMGTGLLLSGCHRQQSSPQAKLPSNNMPVEVIPPTSTAPKPNVSTPNTTTAVSLLPNQYPGMPPIKNSTVQYCQKVCTYNLSGSYFGSPRSTDNICVNGVNQPDGSSHVTAHKGIVMDTQLAPDGKSKCIWEAPGCTVSNGCLTAYDKCVFSHTVKQLSAQPSPCWKFE
jgi:hypothetical protein